MRPKLFHSFLILFSAVVLHFVAVYSGVYSVQLQAGFVWFDNILHMMVGVAFGLLYLWIVRDRNYSPLRNALFLLVFVFVLALLWEAAEYVFFKIFDSYALGLQVYSPSLQEATLDSLSDVVGAAALAVFVYMRRRATDQSHLPLP